MATNRFVCLYLQTTLEQNLIIIVRRDFVKIVISFSFSTYCNYLQILSDQENFNLKTEI